jgi:hypothetical protein
MSRLAVPDTAVHRAISVTSRNADTTAAACSEFAEPPGRSGTGAAFKHIIRAASIIVGSDRFA